MGKGKKATVLTPVNETRPIRGADSESNNLGQQFKRKKFENWILKYGGAVLCAAALFFVGFVVLLTVNVVSVSKARAEERQNLEAIRDRGFVLSMGMTTVEGDYEELEEGGTYRAASQDQINVLVEDEELPEKYLEKSEILYKWSFEDDYTSFGSGSKQTIVVPKECLNYDSVDLDILIRYYDGIYSDGSKERDGARPAQYHFNVVKQQFDKTTSVQVHGKNVERDETVDVGLDENIFIDASPAENVESILIRKFDSNDKRYDTKLFEGVSEAEIFVDEKLSKIEVMVKYTDGLYASGRTKATHCRTARFNVVEPKITEVITLEGTKELQQKKTYDVVGGETISIEAVTEDAIHSIAYYYYDSSTNNRYDQYGNTVDKWVDHKSGSWSLNVPAARLRECGSLYLYAEAMTKNGGPSKDDKGRDVLDYVNKSGWQYVCLQNAKKEIRISVDNNPVSPDTTILMKKDSTVNITAIPGRSCKYIQRLLKKNETEYPIKVIEGDSYSFNFTEPEVGDRYVLSVAAIYTDGLDVGNHGSEDVQYINYTFEIVE